MRDRAEGTEGGIERAKGCATTAVDSPLLAHVNGEGSSDSDERECDRLLRDGRVS
jgi:hypothetical protein